MKSENKRITRLILIYGVLIALIAAFMPRQLDWTPSFQNFKNSPYGAEAVFENIKGIFDEEILVNDQTLYEGLKDTSLSKTNFIAINSDLYFDSLDLDVLYRHARDGNNVFLSAENIAYQLLDSLGLYLQTKFNDFPTVEELEQNSLEMALLSPEERKDSTYEFKTQWSFNYFAADDSLGSTALALGFIEEEKVNFVKVPYGDGYFYLHSFPYALTNYYLMKDKNRSYISSIFSHLPKDYDVIWDEYYKPQSANFRKSPLSVLMRFPSLKWAYWLTLSGIILFMLFYAKRRQRPIPIVTPPKNESLKFIKTLGSLYYNKGSHKDISNKKIKVFKDHLSQNYFLKDITFSAAEAEKIALKSGKSKEDIDRIFDLIHRFEKLESLSDGQLKALIKNINKFYDRKA